MSNRFEPPFERVASAWEANLIIQCMNKRIEVWTLALDDYHRGDLVAMDDTYGIEASNTTWMELQSLGAKPLAMLVQIDEFLNASHTFQTFHTSVGIHPMVREEVVELEAFSSLLITDDERRALQENDPSSVWAELRRLVQQHGWRLVETRAQDGTARMSVRCTLDREAVSPRMTVQEVRAGGLIVIFEQVATFARQLAEVDAKNYENIMRPRRSSGCYIATAVYGSYDCPEVRVLRRWRDARLLPTATGRKLVDAYYIVSPRLVRHLGGYRIFTSVVRPALNALVRHLRRAGLSDAPYSDPDETTSNDDTDAPWPATRKRLAA